MTSEIRAILFGVCISILFGIGVAGCGQQATEPPLLDRPDHPQPALQPQLMVSEWNSLHKSNATRVELLLPFLGTRFDCYFTIEEMFDTIGSASRIQDAHLPAKFDPASRADMIKALADALPGFTAKTDKVSTAVIRIRDVRLTGQADYGIDRPLKASFSGSPDELLQWLGQKQYSVTNHPIGIVISIARGVDGRTPLSIRNYDGSVRRLLTAYLPLSNYSRVFWITESSSESGKLETFVRFSGQLSGIWHRPETPPFPNTLDFTLGETAYGINQDRPQQIPAAIRFIEDHLQPGASQLQVRWAMLYLGHEKAQAGIPILLRHIDYLYTPWGVVREAYPAVKALAQVGPEGAKACLGQL